MKMRQFLIALLIFPITAAAQRSIGVKLIKDGKVCDTCNAPSIYNGGQPVNYMIIGARVENEFLDEKQFPAIDAISPMFSRYSIAAGEFSLDFTFEILQESHLDKAARKKHLQTENFNDRPLQFLVSHNNRIVKNWTDINSLGSDKEYQPGQFMMNGEQERFAAWENYHAGKFKMNINDSLLVLIREADLKKTVDAFFIKRVLFFPKYFDFMKFSADIDLQDILNKKINKEYYTGVVHEDSIDNLEMGPDEIGLFKIGDSRIQHKELEYAFVENPLVWKTLSIDYLPQLSFAYIIINKPAPGKTIELLLRYKQQRESVHRIKIKVREKLTSTTWFKTAATFTAAAVLFTGWYTFKRKKHIRQLRQLTRNKEEIESKLQLLSGQLNPHFLFNSLNSLQTLINKQDTQNANLYLLEVSSFLRAIMDAGKKEYISLQEELSLEEAYIKIEQKRKAFTYRLVNNCTGDLSQVEFPPLLLQPVIENSIHHGLGRDIRNPMVMVSINCTEKKLIVSVEDNGKGFNPSVIKPGHGLAIVQKRISLLNDRLTDIHIEMNVASTDNGTITKFTFESWL